MNATLQPSTHVWRTAGGEASRRGLFSAPVSVGRRVARRLAAYGAVQAPPVFAADGTAFVADLAGHVQAFAASGQRLWDAALEGGISAAPVLASDESLLFAGTHTGRVVALAAATGKLVWQTTVSTKSDPRILSDLLYLPQAKRLVLSSWGGRYVALAAASGAVAGDWDAGISPGAAAAADAAENLYCLRAVASRGIEWVRLSAAGQEAVLHREPETSRGARRALVVAAPVLDEARGLAYLIINGDRRSALAAWSLADGQIRWREEIPVGVQATPAVRQDGVVIVADLGGVVHGYSAGGWRLFSFRTDGDYFLAGPVVDALGRAYLGDPLGRLHVIEADGRVRIRVELSRAIQGRAAFDPSGNLHVPGTDKAVHVLPGRTTAA